MFTWYFFLFDIFFRICIIDSKYYGGEYYYKSWQSCEIHCVECNMISHTYNTNNTHISWLDDINLHLPLHARWYLDWVKLDWHISWSFVAFVLQPNLKVKLNWSSFKHISWSKLDEIGLSTTSWGSQPLVINPLPLLALADIFVRCEAFHKINLSATRYLTRYCFWTVRYVMKYSAVQCIAME